MTYGAYAPRDFARADRDRFFDAVASKTFPGIAALAFAGMVGACILNGRTMEPTPTNPAPTVAIQTIASTAPITPATPGAAARSTVATPPPATYTAMLDPGYSPGQAAAPFTQTVPLGSDFATTSGPILPIPPRPAAAPRARVADVPPPQAEAPVQVARVAPDLEIAPPEADVPLPPARAESATTTIELPQDAPPWPLVRPAAPGIPLPMPRPPELHRFAEDAVAPAHVVPRRLARLERPMPSSPPADRRSFFEKIFNVTPASGTALAYAAPEAGIIGNLRRMTSAPAPTVGQGTAVYDIAAHTVYLPNGTRLEAHSGLGSGFDDPRYVTAHMRGPTPPDVYELTPREQLFHGVRALRLNPVNGSTFGRTGLLAHTYMLGARGESNGCVSFRNYNAFLQAYERGEIRRLAVVASLH